LSVQAMAVRVKKKKTGVAGILYEREPKLSGLSTSSLSKDSPHTALCVSGASFLMSTTLGLVLLPGIHTALGALTLQFQLPQYPEDHGRGLSAHSTFLLIGKACF
jgi:hypothetical protein